MKKYVWYSAEEKNVGDLLILSNNTIAIIYKREEPCAATSRVVKYYHVLANQNCKELIEEDSALFTDFLYTPVMPVEYISIDFTIDNKGETNE